MLLTIDFRPEHHVVQPASMNIVNHTGGWWSRLKEATVERYREWRFDRDVQKIHAALERLSDRQLELIGCRREWLIEDVHRLIRGNAMVEWCNRSLPSLAWLPPTPEPGGRASLIAASRERA